jgi:Tfp pilus assembly protein PilF
MNKLFSALRGTFEKKPVLFSVLLITVLLLIFYSNSFTADWHYDDFHHIKENINIRKLSNISLFFKDPTTFSRNPNSRMYRPLLMTTYAINYQISLMTSRDGYNVIGYHVVNFLFHLISALAIFFIVLFFFRRKIVVPGLNPALPALFAGLLFGLNTINTETVVYLSSRSSGMATAFVLLSFFLYLKAGEKTKVHWGLMAGSVFLYGCGLLSKEIAITLPAMLLLYELLLNGSVWQGTAMGTSLSRLTVRLAPHGSLSLGYLLLRRVILDENLAARIIAKGAGPATPHFTSQLATQARAWVYYFREFLWPMGLSIDKPFRISLKFSEPVVVASVVIILVIVAGAVVVRKRHPAFTFGVLWFFIALLPTSLFRLNVPINDHRLYLSGFGAVLAFTWVAARLYMRFKADSPRHLTVFTTVCLATLLLMGLSTFKRNSAFATEETMWRDVILKDSKSIRGYNNLGIYYEQQGELDKAIRFYSKTVSLAPMFPNPYINLGNVYHKKKDYRKGSEYMLRAIKLDPRSALAHYNLGNIYREWGNFEKAITAYQTALKLNPRYIEAANNLANIHFKRNNFQEAIKYYEHALRIDPTFAMSYYNIGLSLERMGMPDEAVANMEKFIRFWTGDAKFVKNARDKIRRLSARSR